MKDFTHADELCQAFEAVTRQARIPQKSDELLVGLDIGTAYLVLVVLNSRGEPLAGALRFAQVVRDGIVVDYLGAIEIVRVLKSELEQALGRELERTAIALPPGTNKNDMRFIANVAEGAGLRVVRVVDEPVAANTVLGLQNGTVVDVGGGTTGLAIIENGTVVYTADEPTGGTHATLVIAGNRKVSFEEAEAIKRDPTRQEEIGRLLKPVSQKIARIIGTHIAPYHVHNIVMVGGASCLHGIEAVIEEELGIHTTKPAYPLFVTPLGIALNCFEEGVGLWTFNS